MYIKWNRNYFKIIFGVKIKSLHKYLVSWNYLAGSWNCEISSSGIKFLFQTKSSLLLSSWQEALHTAKWMVIKSDSKRKSSYCIFLLASCYISCRSLTVFCFWGSCWPALLVEKGCNYLITNSNIYKKGKGKLFLTVQKAQSKAENVTQYKEQYKKQKTPN